MTDRELLELAAKAAGIGFNEKRSPTGNIALYCGPRVGWWNPLTDDGDALRLAVKCEIAINPWAGKTVCWHERSKATTHETHDCNDDPYAATRRAIVRAAAEVGRAKRPLDVVHQALQAEASISYVQSDAETYGFEEPKP
jgi:hypothetical protein